MTIVARPVIFLTTGCARAAKAGARRSVTMPITSGTSTTASSGLAMIQALTLRPSTSSGTAKGMKATMPTAASSMKLAV